MIQADVSRKNTSHNFMIQSCHLLEQTSESLSEIVDKSDIILQTPHKYREMQVKKQLHAKGLSDSKINYIIQLHSIQVDGKNFIDELSNKEIARAKSFEEFLTQQKSPHQEIGLIEFEDDDEGNDNGIDNQESFEEYIEENQNKQQKINSGDILIDIAEDMNGNQEQSHEDIQQESDQQQSQQQHSLDSENNSDNQGGLEQNGCPICSSTFEDIVKLLECEHKFCRSCYKEYLEDRIKVAKINNIPCPQQECPQTFTQDLIQQLVSKEKYIQYLVFKRKIEIENDPNKKWCPARGCDKYVTKDPKTNIVKCDCGTMVCFNCGNLQHPGQLCEQAIEGDFQVAIHKYHMKYCPHCRSHIEKNAGCNHMTCAKCAFQFCWVCLQPYHQYHYRYWSVRGCAIWSNGRFKTNKIIENPDQRRKIYYAPRLFLYIIRGPLLIVKLTLIAAGKAFFTPFSKLNKKMFKGKKPKSCICTAFFVLIAEIFIILLVVMLFPFSFLFYRIPKEIQWLSIKGCAY